MPKVKVTILPKQIVIPGNLLLGSATGLLAEINRTRLGHYHNPEEVRNAVAKYHAQIKELVLFGYEDIIVTIRIKGIR